MVNPRLLPHSPYQPLDRDVSLYHSALGHLVPWEFSGWKQESLSWKKGCYLHAGQNPALPYRSFGADALKLFQDACINDFSSFPIGSSQHGVMCNRDGHVMANGMIWRVDAEEFISFRLSPYLDFLVERAGHDVQGEDLSGQVFVFQVAGPRALDALEAAAGESLRDIDVLWHRPSRIRGDGPGESGLAVRIYRLGAGTPSYEVHGNIRDAKAVYRAIMKAGEDFGIQRLGMQAYGMHHTESGTPQAFLHFLPAWAEDEAFMQHVHEAHLEAFSALPGSAGPDARKRYANPVELGWGQLIRFDHDFPGRQALERQMEGGGRRIVTLEWNKEDILDIYGSQFRQGADVQFMDFATDPVWQGHTSLVFADDVYAGDTRVGMSSGRMFSYSYKAMISLCLIDAGLARIGTEVDILWGDPGTRQKRIRARVSRFPFLDLPDGPDRDVHAIDHGRPVRGGVEATA